MAGVSLIGSASALGTGARIGLRILMAPVWLGWQAYNGVWWAFNDEPRRAAAQEDCAPPGVPFAADHRGTPPTPQTDAPAFGEGQQAAFEVVEPSPAPETPDRPKPVGTLKVGYTATLAASLLTAVIAGNTMNSSGWALMLWAWVTMIVAVASIYMVRAVVARRERERPKTRWGRIKSAVAGVGDVGVSACTGAGAAAKRGYGWGRTTFTRVRDAVRARGAGKAPKTAEA